MPRNGILLRTSSRGRAGINQSLGDGIDPEVEPCERAGAQQDQIGRLAEHHFVDGPGTGCINPCRTSPAFQDGSTGPPEKPKPVAFDTQRLQDTGRNPGQFRAGVYQNTPDDRAPARVDRVFDFNLDSEASHLARHDATRYFP